VSSTLEEISNTIPEEYEKAVDNIAFNHFLDYDEDDVRSVTTNEIKTLEDMFGKTFPAMKKTVGEKHKTHETHKTHSVSQNSVEEDDDRSKENHSSVEVTRDVTEKNPSSVEVTRDVTEKNPSSVEEEPNSVEVTQDTTEENPSSVEVNQDVSKENHSSVEVTQNTTEVTQNATEKVPNTYSLPKEIPLINAAHCFESTSCIIVSSASGVLAVVVLLTGVYYVYKKQKRYNDINFSV
jgi:hypothetical protein